MMASFIEHDFLIAVESDGSEDEFRASTVSRTYTQEQMNVHIISTIWPPAWHDTHRSIFKNVVSLRIVLGLTYPEYQEGARPWSYIHRIDPPATQK